MADWINFPRLGRCPVSPDAVVSVLFRGDAEPRPSRYSYLAKQLRWDRFKGQSEPLPFDIIGYRMEAQA